MSDSECLPGLLRLNVAIGKDKSITIMRAPQNILLTYFLPRFSEIVLIVLTGYDFAAILSSQRCGYR